MKSILKRVLPFFAFLASLAFSADLLAKPLPPPKSIKTGVIVLAHGGNATWNENVRKTVKEARLIYPVEVVFGMGMHDIETYQRAVNKLQNQNIENVIVVPLLISSHSEVFQQYQYLFRQRSTPAIPEWRVPQLTLSVPVVFTGALDHDPLVADILLERLRGLSKKPGHEAVVLVGHGPNDDIDNAAWINSMNVLGDILKTQGHFQDVRVVTLREDAAPPIKAKATLDFRYTVADFNHQYDVLVLPLLMSEGGIERGIPERLKGLTYKFKPKGLLPHPKISEWIRDRVTQLASSLP